MSADPFEPVEVDEYAPPLADAEEWLIPKDRPDDRIVVLRVPDDAPALVREGIARQRLQVIEGVCPCGGRIVWSDGNPERGRLGRAVHQHWDDCPAGPAVFVPAMEAWREEREGGA